MRNRLFLSLTAALSLGMMLFAALAPAPAKLPYEGRTPSRFSLRDPDAYFFDRLPHRRCPCARRAAQGSTSIIAATTI